MKIPNDNHVKSRKQLEEERKAHKSKVWFIVKVTSFFLVVGVALGLIFNQQLMAMYVKNHTTPSNYMKVSAEQMKKNAKEKGNFEDGDNHKAVPVSPANLVKAAMSGQSKPVIGGVAVPELGINLPILVDDGDYSMLYGAGPLKPGQVMGEGNYALASHDMWTNVSYYSKDLLFSPLKIAKTGQNVYLTDKDKVYHYVITNVDTISPTDWDSTVNAEPGKKTVTLVTCDTNDAYRIRVRGELKDVKPFDDSTSGPFTGKFNQYYK